MDMNDPYYVKMVNRETDEVMETKIFGNYYDALDYAEKSKDDYFGYTIFDFNHNVVEYEV